MKFTLTQEAASLIKKFSAQQVIIYWNRDNVLRLARASAKSADEAHTQMLAEAGYDAIMEAYARNGAEPLTGGITEFLTSEWGVRPIPGEPFRFHVASASRSKEHFVDLEAFDWNGGCSCERFVEGGLKRRMERDGTPHDNNRCAHIKRARRYLMDEVFPVLGHPRLRFLMLAALEARNDARKEQQ